MKEATPALPPLRSPCAGSDWFDPLEEAVRGQVRSFIEQLLEEELEVALGRGRYERGRRHVHRPRQLVTTFGPLSLSGPRARLHDEAGEQEWKSALLPAYKRLSRRAEALIAEAYLAGMNTRRVRRALAKLFEGHIGKDIVSRAWPRTRSAWAAWQQRDLAGKDIVRLILDGTVVRVRLDRKATAISLLIALGIRRDGQKLVLAIKNMGGESEAAWRTVLDDLLARGMAQPELVMTRSRPTSTTWCTPKRRPRSWPGARRSWPNGSSAVACTRSSNDGSCCPAPRPPPCCSGRSSPRVRSPCAGSPAGRPSTAPSPTLTSPPDPDHHATRFPRRPISTNFATRPR
jgi:hypothetical protein